MSKHRHKKNISHLVENMARGHMAHLNAKFRIARSGVPHILVHIAGVFYSCCYFSSTNTWRVFWPSMVFADNQHKETFNSPYNMIAWLECEKDYRERG